MKNRIGLIILAIVITSFFGCSKEDIPIPLAYEFDQEYDFTMIKQILVRDTAFVIQSPAIPSTLGTASSTNGTSVDRISSVSLTKMTLSVTTPSTQTLDFLSKIEVTIIANGVSENISASKIPVPTGTGAILELDVKSVNMLEILKSKSIKFKISLGVDDYLPQETELKMNSTFVVEATLL